MQRAFQGIKLGNIRHPDHVGSVHGKLSIQQVFGYREFMIGISRHNLERLFPYAIQSMFLLKPIGPIATAVGILLPNVLPKLIEAAHALTFRMAFLPDGENVLTL